MRSEMVEQEKLKEEAIEREHHNIRKSDGREQRRQKGEGFLIN